MKQKTILFIHKLNEILKRNNDLDNEDSRQCSLCHGSEHYINTCPFRKEALEFYKEK